MVVNNKYDSACYVMLSECPRVAATGVLGKIVKKAATTVIQRADL
jgi:hypothetical protein